MATNRGIYLRLPPGLRERVDRAAAEEAARRGRPLTLQQWIREVLERALQQSGAGAPEASEAREEETWRSRSSSPLSRRS